MELDFCETDCDGLRNSTFAMSWQSIGVAGVAWRAHVGSELLMRSTSSLLPDIMQGRRAFVS